MLSPHELATLHLMQRAPDQVDIQRAELGALTRQNLVHEPSDCPDHSRVTARGLWVLRRLGLSG